MIDKPISIMVVDDEPLSREYIASLVAKDSRFRVESLCSDGRVALKQFSFQSPEAVFVDLQMPHVNGFDFCSQIDLVSTCVVFITAHGEKALRAFDFNATDFVTKPIRTDRFSQTLDRVFDRVCEKRILKVDSNVSSDSKTLHTSKGELFFTSREIQFIESSGNYIKVWIQNSPHLVRAKFSHFCESLGDPNILIVHRSFAVNIEQVRSVTSSRSRGALLKLKDCEKQIPVSRSRRAILRELLSSLGRETEG